MRSSNGTICVSINIGKHDQDIANWFNMLRSAGHSKSMWVSAILISYDEGKKLDLGCVSTPTEKQNIYQSHSINSTNISSNKSYPTKSLIFGTGGLSSKPRRTDSGWGNRGVNGEYIIGSTITIRLTNRRVIGVYKQLVKEENNVSRIIKYVIRSCVKTGPKDVPPDINSAVYILTFPPLRPLLSVDSGISNNNSPILSSSKESSHTIESRPAEQRRNESEPVHEAEKAPQTTSKNPLLEFI